MKKSVNLYFDFSQDVYKKLDQIKAAGYDEFFTGTNDLWENASLENQIDYAQKLGLPCSMTHCAYVKHNLDNFWLDNELGQNIVTDYINQIERCKSFTKNFVIHLHGTYNAITSQLGLNRLKQILSVCEKYNINLCVENLLNNDEIPYIFSNLKHKNLKICFDIGHRNFTPKHLEVMKDYGQHVAVLHLHDNFGKRDDHMICGTGTINWDKFAKEVAPYNLTLCAEIKIRPEDDKQTYLQQNFVALCKLEEKIKFYKQQLN